jgi:hypothetical protein
VGKLSVNVSHNGDSREGILDRKTAKRSGPAYLPDKWTGRGEMVDVTGIGTSCLGA